MFRWCLLAALVAAAAPLPAGEPFHTLIIHDRSRWTTSESTTTTTWSTVTERASTICAVVINVTGACVLDAAGRWLDDPLVLTFDDVIEDDVDQVVVPHPVQKVEATPAARMELRSGAPTELAASIAERWSAARHRPTFRKPIGLVSSLVSRVRAKNKKRPSASLASPASSSSEDASDEEDGSDSAVNDPQVYYATVILGTETPPASQRLGAGDGHGTAVLELTSFPTGVVFAAATTPPPAAGGSGGVATRTATVVSTTTATFFIQRCTPSPFLFDACQTSKIQ